MRQLVVVVTFGMALTGCAVGPSAPILIGQDTYLMSKQNSAGMFGDVSVLAASMMADGNAFCSARNLHFQLEGETLTQPSPGRTGGDATIQFQCVEHLRPVHLRPDNGVSTVTTK